MKNVNSKDFYFNSSSNIDDSCPSTSVYNVKLECESVPLDDDFDMEELQTVVKEENKDEILQLINETRGEIWNRDDFFNVDDSFPSTSVDDVKLECEELQTLVKEEDKDAILQSIDETSGKISIGKDNTSVLEDRGFGRMEMNVDSIDTKRLIISVENEPSLWDSSHNDYSDRVVKKNAWETVMKEFIVDFDSKTQMEKKEIVAVVQRKWKHLRDSFTRELSKRKQEARSGSGASARKSYIYFDQLKFLQTAIKPTISSLDDDQSRKRVFGGDQDSSQDTQGSVSSPDVFEVEALPQKRKKEKKQSRVIRIR